MDPTRHTGTGFSCGSSPIADAAAASQKLLELSNIDRVLVVGYSYGSIVAMASTEAIPESLGWVSIAPPLDYVWALFLFNGRAVLDQAHTSLPKLLIHPTRDQFCATKSFDDYFAALPEPKIATKVRGATHFDLVNHIPGALAQWLQTAFGVDDVGAFARGNFLNTAS